MLPSQNVQLSFKCEGSAYLPEWEKKAASAISNNKGSVLTILATIVMITLLLCDKANYFLLFFFSFFSFIFLITFKIQLVFNE